MTSRIRVGAAVAVASCGAALLLMGERAAAQSATNVWSGVYSEAQAGRGKKAYIDACAACHQEGLQGADLAPPLKGDDFILRWADQSVYDLVTTITTTMPADSPGSLKPQDTSDIVAYMFQVNRVPAGKDDLGSDAAALKAIMVTKRPAQ